MDIKTTHVVIISFVYDLFDEESNMKFLRGFEFQYDKSTRVEDLYRTSSDFCGCPYDQKRFYMVLNNEYSFPRMDVMLEQIIYTFNQSSPLVLYYLPLGGGLGIDEVDGIRFFMHSNENRITPHIHAEYQGEEISIDLLSLKVTGRLKNKKKLSEAVDYAKKNNECLKKKYADYTTGLQVDDFTVWKGAIIH